jgi:hypothetical protein
MRTKTALTCVAALAAGVATSMAQSNVYSLNVVGYYNVTVGHGQKIMIANQLNTTNNTIGSLLVPPMVGNNDSLFKFANGGFSPSQYSTDDGQWDPDPSVSLNPGEAAFFINAQPGTETLTFVGEVLQGSLTNTLPLGTKVLRSSIVPQTGLISTDLGVPYDNNDNLFVYNTVQNSGGYTPYQYSTDDGQWDPSEPVINVGQGFFYVKAPTANPADANWVRNFTVQ